MKRNKMTTDLQKALVKAMCVLMEQFGNEYEFLPQVEGKVIDENTEEFEVVIKFAKK